MSKIVRSAFTVNHGLRELKEIDYTVGVLMRKDKDSMSLERPRSKK